MDWDSIFLLTASDNTYRMLWEENSSQNLKKSASSEKDLYALDKAAFYAIGEPEIWDFSEALEMKREFISFFIMRAILHKKKTGQKLELKDIQPSIKAQVQRLGFAKWMNDFFAGAFFPSLVTKQNDISLDFFKDFESEYSYVQLDMKKSSFMLTGGGVLLKPNLRLQEPIEELFQKFDLAKKQGIFYYRTTRNSYFYPLEPESKSRVFFVQERNALELPFHFFYIDCKG